ncbi:MAG: DNA polymerase IV [Thermoproteota archaeon]
MKIIACIDLDYFYTQCEEVLNPSIKGKPVVVCMYSGRSEESGAVATANYVARKYGVKSGMPIKAAKKLLKDIEAYFIPANLELYDSISTRVMDIARKYADAFEQVSVDEAYIDITKISNNDYFSAIDLMKKMKEEIYEKEKLTCSVGIGPTKVIAKIATELKKPNGLECIRPEEIPTKVWPLPVDSLLGVGPKSKIKLESIGVKTIGDLLKVDFTKLVNLFGKKIATYFVLAAQGKETEPIRENYQVKQFSRMITLKSNTLALSEIRPYLEELAKDLSSILKDYKVYAKGISVMAVLDDLSIISKSKLVEKPINSYEEIFKIAEGLLVELIKKSQRLFRRLALRAYEIVSYENIETLEKFIEN